MRRKRDVAANILGAVGLITLRRADQIGMVYGDARGCVNIRQRRGETHIESMLHRFYGHTLASPAQATSPVNWTMWQRITAIRC